MVQPAYRTLNPELTPAVSIIRLSGGSRALKCDNFVAASFNTNENVTRIVGRPSVGIATLLLLPSARNLWRAKNYQLCKTAATV